jgi:hypothetical protein
MSSLRKHSIIPPVAVLAFALVQPALAADYAGTYKGSITKQESFVVTDNGQHVIALNTSTGTNKSVGKSGYFDGGAIVVNGYTDMVNGNGTHLGYITFDKDGEQVTNSLNGKVSTVMAADGKTPITTIDGTFDGLYGTNIYGTMHPSGTYHVKFTSPTEYVCDWEVTGFK